MERVLKLIASARYFLITIKDRRLPSVVDFLSVKQQDTYSSI